jgi:N-acyl-D-aspartate/D-glutamate deacylase
MTSLPAWCFGQIERDHIAEGAFGDITVFDAQTIIDRASCENPHQYAIGVDHVIVNGVFVIESASLTGGKPGYAAAALTATFLSIGGYTRR